MPGERPVLLLHGIDDTGAVFDMMACGLTAAGWTVHRLDMTPCNGDGPLELLAGQVVAYADAHLAEGSFDLVCFSMGGIIGRYYLQRLGGLARVRCFVTISSPHHGTWMAHFRGNIGSRQMQPNSPFMADLNRDVERLFTIPVTSIWTPLDLMIVPAWSSHLPGARDVRILCPLHPLMLRSRRTLAAVMQALSR